MSPEQVLVLGRGVRRTDLVGDGEAGDVHFTSAYLIEPTLVLRDNGLLKEPFLRRGRVQAR